MLIILLPMPMPMASSLWDKPDERISRANSANTRPWACLRNQKLHRMSCVFHSGVLSLMMRSDLHDTRQLVSLAIKILPSFASPSPDRQPIPDAERKHEGTQHKVIRCVSSSAVANTPRTFPPISHFLQTLPRLHRLNSGGELGQLCGEMSKERIARSRESV
jgi:hypothetical protein